MANGGADIERLSTAISCPERLRRTDRFRSTRRASFSVALQKPPKTLFITFASEHYLSVYSSDHGRSSRLPLCSVFAAMIMKISYGIDVSERNDRYITMAEEAADSVVKAGMPGTYWVDIMPFREISSSRSTPCFMRAA